MSIVTAILPCRWTSTARCPQRRPRRRSSASATSSERRSCEPSCRTLLKYGHERGPLRRAERASDLGGDTGDRTPDLLLANSRLGRRSLSLSTYAPHTHQVRRVGAQG